MSSLATFAELGIPPTWGRTYARKAKEVPSCADYRTSDLATELMRALLDQALREEVLGKTWSPGSLDWS